MSTTSSPLPTSGPFSPGGLLQANINNVLQVAVQNFGIKYSEGSDRLGPHAFDCSSYVWNAYLQGAGINIGEYTGAQLASPIATAVTPSASNLVNPSGGPPYTYADLQPGDLIYWGNSVADVNSQHVEMYFGGTVTYGGTTYVDSSVQPVVVAEYHGGDVSHPSYLGLNPNGTIAGDGVAPVLAVLRFQQAILDKIGAPSTYTSQGVAPLKPVGQGGSSTTGVAPSFTSDLADPRNNLPFSSYFMSQRTNFGDYKGVSPLYSERHLVRGGIAQSTAMGKRPRGQFTCYFMMNPASISVDYGIDTSGAVPQANTPQATAVPIVTTSAGTITFQVIFNRMYEVWRGDTPGPSDIGCRWDVRALERLIGIYDNFDPANPTGLHGIGGGSNTMPLVAPVQAVFGSQNSIIFSGYISNLSYEYTMFSKDMIPIECTASVSILALWLSNTGKDVINSIVNVPSDYYTPAGSGAPQVASSGPLRGFLGVSS